MANLKFWHGLFLLLPATMCIASNGWVLQQPQTNVMPNQDFYARLPAPFIDDVVLGDSPTSTLTKAQQHQAAVWGLTSTEEARYLMLMQNQSGTYYQHAGLTPVQILGINARTDLERNHFAALAAVQMAQRLAKELAFATAYNQAYSAMMQPYHLPAVREFSKDNSSERSNNPLQLQSHDKLILFVNPKQSPPPLIQQALQSVIATTKSELAIYFIGANMDDAMIEAWANNQSIPSALVKQGVITLNLHNTQLWQTLKNRYGLPALFLVRNGKTTALTG